MASGYQDWTRAIRLLGVDGDGNPVTVLLDAGGRLYSLITGQDADGDPLVVRLDGDGQMIMVPRGQSGHYMAIDSDGYMTAILKGAYAGALRTIGLDDEGRITAYLVDDESQWGDIVKTGNAELAARLGSPQAYDWRGKVIWWTDFRHGLGGIATAANGAGALVALDPTHFVSGGYSAKLTGGSDGEGYARLITIVDIPPTSRVGIYVRWAGYSALAFLEIRAEAYDGAKHHLAAVRYDEANTELDYLDSGYNWQSLASQKFALFAHSWHGLKLVFDKSTDKYARALAGSTEHDMSALDVYNVASGTRQQLACTVQLYSTAGENEYAWIDSMVITVGEPE